MTVRLNRNEAAIAPAHVLRALATLDGDALRTYPVDKMGALCAAIANRLGVEPNNVTLGNGADEVLLAICRAFLLPGDGCAIASPAFEMYEQAIALARGRVIRVPYRRRWQVDAAEIVDAAAEASLVILANPNNPTGDGISEGTLRFLCSKLPAAMIAIDEVYCSFSQSSLLRIARTIPNAVLIGSLSKCAGLAGLRVGYAVSSAAVATALQNCIAPYPIGVASLAAALAYFEDAEATRAYEAALAAQSKRSLDAIERALGPLADDLWRGDANFLLADLGTRADSIVRRLSSYGIAVRTFADPSLRGMIRICGGTDEDTAALRAVLDGLPEASAARA